jgi:hypothetical protein
MKLLRITMELPMPEEATQEDADALARLIGSRCLTQRPVAPPSLFEARAFGKVTKVKLVKLRKE